MSEEEVGFDVVDEVIVGDLTDVRQEILPASQSVRFRIDKAGMAINKDKDLKGLKLELAIVEGIPDAEGNVRFIGKKAFTGVMDLCYWANPETRTKQWFKSKQHLLEFKAFCKALDIDITNVKVNDEFFSTILGREVLANIIHEEESLKDASGVSQKTGVFKERLKGWKKAA